MNENRMIHFLFERIPSKSKVMLDVGAHFGGSLGIFLSDDWNIYAFEPDSSNRKKLEDKYGNNTNLEIFPYACSDENQENVPFFKSEVSTGISSLLRFHSGHSEAEHVKVIRLADFLRERNINDVAYLKIDTEGYDLNVLKGLDWNFTKPLVILAEFEDAKTKHLGYSYKDLGDFLVDKGYQVFLSEWYPIVQYGTQHSWNRIIKYPVDTMTDNAWGNFIALL
jgi:FkbM family methyltransferase